MKIRWNGSGVRFRITPSELAALEAGQAIGESLVVGGVAAWSTRVAPGAGTTELALDADGVLELRLCADDLAELADPEREGVYFRDGRFRFYIEKDFPCAHPRAGEAAEPETEAFEPPPGFDERKNS